MSRASTSSREKKPSSRKSSQKPPPRKGTSSRLLPSLCGPRCQPRKIPRHRCTRGEIHGMWTYANRWTSRSQNDRSRTHLLLKGTSDTHMRRWHANKTGGVRRSSHYFSRQTCWGAKNPNETTNTATNHGYGGLRTQLRLLCCRIPRQTTTLTSKTNWSSLPSRSRLYAASYIPAFRVWVINLHKKDCIQKRKTRQKHKLHGRRGRSHHCRPHLSPQVLVPKVRMLQGSQDRQNAAAQGPSAPHEGTERVHDLPERIHDLFQLAESLPENLNPVPSLAARSHSWL